MTGLSSTDLAIRLAVESGTIHITENINRFGDPFFAVEDNIGLIEVHLTRAEAEARVRGDNPPASSQLWHPRTAGETTR